MERFSSIDYGSWERAAAAPVIHLGGFRMQHFNARHSLFSFEPHVGAGPSSHPCLRMSTLTVAKEAKCRPGGRAA